MLDGVRRNYQFSGQLPAGTSDLTLVELQEMASRQQQVVETQQQVLVAKEQRLKYLRQQEARHVQLASESERLRKIRERVENQELKLKKLRALRDQAEQYRINNGNLNNELEAVKNVFSEKEKELAMAVAKVDQLTRQLKDLKSGVNNGTVNNKQTASNSELEKLRKELLMRNKLNEQQSNMLATKEKLLNDRREKVALMDVRIQKLQQRLKKRQLQEQHVNLQGNKVIKHPAGSSVPAAEPYVQYPSQNLKDESHMRTAGFSKQDNRHQILPSDSKFSNPSLPYVDNSMKRQDVNINELVEEYKLPVVLQAASSGDCAEKVPRQSLSYTQRPLPPERSNKPNTTHDNDVKQNSNIQKLGFIQYPVTKPISGGSHFLPVGGRGAGDSQRPYVSIKGGDGSVVNTSSAGQDSSSLVPGMLPPSTTSSSIHPIINISDEERQAGSGQSSPASTESSPNPGSGVQVKDISEQVNTSSIGPVSAMIEKLNKNVGRLDGQTQQQTSSNVVGLKRMNFTQKPHGHPTDGNGTSQMSKMLNNVPSDTNRPTGTYVNTHSSAVNFPSSLPQDEVNSPQLGIDSPHSQSSITTSVNSSGATSNSNPPSVTSSGGPHLNQKPAMTYRYASKNTIANTYMGRLGSAAMEKYQKDLNLLYKNVDSQENKDVISPDEIATSFTHSPSVDTISTSQGHPQFGAVISSPSYPDIASDKGSFKLHTPKQVRRKHSDSENDDLNKALQEQKERAQQQQQRSQQQQQRSQQQTGNEASLDIKALSVIEPLSPSPEKSKPSADIIKPIKNSQQTPPDNKQPEPPSVSTAVTQKGDTSLSPPAVTKSASISKADVVLRNTKSNLKKDGSRKSNNRVSFDPLALLLDASLEGELDLVRKVALQVDDVSTPNDEGITALHNAICAGHYDIVTVLVEFGCDVNSPDSDGWTPLHCAASCNNLLMVRFLVEHGACVFATTISDHETAADKCEEDEDGYDSCSDYLYSIQEKLGIANNGEVYAVFDYQATNVDELSFRNGDKLMVMRKGDDSEKEWWWAHANGKEGYIPRNLLGLHPRVVPKSKEVSEC